MTSRNTSGVVPDAAWYAETVSCRAACPVGTDAAGYVQAIADGRMQDAYDLARAHNPLPSICGRICSAPCERACRRGLLDAPVAIRALKRVACDAFDTPAERVARWHRAHGPVPAAHRESVGIVGAGPAGLAAAYDLRRAGHAVTLYDAESEPGGLMLSGIPAFRLARELVREEIRAVMSLGIDFVGGCRVGADVPLERLREEHDSVLLTHGCSVGRSLPVPGASLPGVTTALAFLHAYNQGRMPAVPSPLVVIGGGSVAFDAARAAQRLVVQGGASALTSHLSPTDVAVPAVQLLAPEAFESLPVPDEELREAAAEGVVIRAGVGVRTLTGVRQVDGVQIAPVVSLRNAAGRLDPLLAEGADEWLAASTVIVAVGQFADASLLGGREETLATSWGGVATLSPDGRTTEPRLYAAGDVTSGPGDLIDAVASGQRAAARIIADYGGTPLDSPLPDLPRGRSVPMARRYWSGYDTVSRRRLPVLPPTSRDARAEVERTLAVREAQREASRCLVCDAHITLDVERCIGCALCVDVCPYGCIAMAGGVDTAADPLPQFALTLDEASCIRCGLCVDRCPPHALELVRV